VVVEKGSQGEYSRGVARDFRTVWGNSNSYFFSYGHNIPSIRGRAMLENLSNQVRECLRHAEDCVQQAASQTDLKLRRDYLIIGACWLKLSSELSEQLANFSKPKRHDQQFTAPAKLDEGMEEDVSPIH